MVDLQFLISGEGGISFQYHYSHVYSEPEWWYLFMGQKDLLKIIRISVNRE